MVSEMIKYPNGNNASSKKMQSSNSKIKIGYGDRGMNLENRINISNDYYREREIAVIYKKPTPIQVVHIYNTPSGSTKIDDAYFLTPSTTDYNGVYKGKYIDFEAKETRNKSSFPLQNLHKHQIEHLMSIIKHGGIGFLIVYFSTLEKTFLLDARIVYEHYIGKINSIPFSVFEEKGHIIEEGYILPLDYLKCVDKTYFNE